MAIIEINQLSENNYKNLKNVFLNNQLFTLSELFVMLLGAGQIFAVILLTGVVSGQSVSFGLISPDIFSN